MTENRFFNRELSWIEFNSRVLFEAERDENPLFEQLKFLAITETNFDEFFQVRVAALKRSLREDSGPHEKNSSSAKHLLKKISERVHEITSMQNKILDTKLLPSLKEKGIQYIPPEEYSKNQKSFVESFFIHNVFPLLTPLRATKTDEFPNAGNLKLNAVFLIEPIKGIGIEDKSIFALDEKQYVAVVQVPSNVHRVIFLPSENRLKKQWTLLDDIIRYCGRQIFPGYTVLESMIFKIARDADFSVDEDSGSNFIQAMEEVLEKRESSFAVRMEYTPTSKHLMNFIKDRLSLSSEDLYEVPGIIDPSFLVEIADMEGYENLLNPEWKNFYPADLPEEGNYFNTIRQKDVLLHLPYQSFDPVVRFLQTSARDENVLAIKITLYRPGINSPIIEALKEAAQNGKQVTAFVELKARFDEKRNISWVSELEKAGIIVVYGIVNLKVHAKVILIVRKESDTVRRYAHISTGNYNAKTARIYQDLSVFTSKAEIVSDVSLFFNVISGYSALQKMQHLYMAPVTLKSKILELIEKQTRLSKKESPSYIAMKVNSLCHPEIISALYQASQAGVKIDLNVRGICTLVPGIEGLSENIRVVSVIDRYLEHSRVFYFQNSGGEELFISSSDMMDRNLDRRIELMMNVTDKNIFAEIKEILLAYFRDNTHSHILLEDGRWKRRLPLETEENFRVQEHFHRKYKALNEQKKRSQAKGEFIVRRKWFGLGKKK